MKYSIINVQMIQEYQILLYFIWFYFYSILWYVGTQYSYFKGRMKVLKRTDRNKTIIIPKFYKFSRLLMILSYFILFNSSSYIYILVSIYFTKCWRKNKELRIFESITYIPSNSVSIFNFKIQRNQIHLLH